MSYGNYYTPAPPPEEEKSNWKDPRTIFIVVAGVIVVLCMVLVCCLLGYAIAKNAASPADPTARPALKATVTPRTASTGTQPALTNTPVLPTLEPPLEPTALFTLPPEDPSIGFTAPDFSLESLAGGMVHLAELRGHPIIINFWASWCGPCTDEMPMLETVFQRHQDEGFILLAVNITSNDSRSDAKRVINDSGYSFPVLFDDDGDVQDTYLITNIPTSYFVDVNGVIRDVMIGSYESEEDLENMLITILK